MGYLVRHLLKVENYIGSRNKGSRQEMSSLSLVSKSHSVKLELTKTL